MNLTKRTFLKASTATIASLPFGASVLAAKPEMAAGRSPTALKSIIGNVKPISSPERIARIAKAQKLMQAHDIAALVIEPGAAMDYFSGIQWWRSERLTAIVIPREGEIGVV